MCILEVNGSVYPKTGSEHECRGKISKSVLVTRLQEFICAIAYISDRVITKEFKTKNNSVVTCLTVT
ncbi:hypothetical protein NSMS1_14790 [Nostoc sp. MS1]|nr:hypothetical protein NSMS1_14790 [Nostoc sp. MS1]